MKSSRAWKRRKPSLDYEFEIEITNFIVRVRPKGSDPTTFDVAVACVVADHVHAVTKALSPEKKFVREHGEAIQAAIESLGFVVKGYRAKTGEWKTMTAVAKKALPDAKLAKSDADHITNAVLSLEQLGFTVSKTHDPHYGVKNVSITQSPGANGEVHHSGSWTTYPLNLDEPAV